MYQIAKICKLKKYKSYSDLYKKPFIKNSRILYLFMKGYLLKNTKSLNLILN